MLMLRAELTSTRDSQLLNHLFSPDNRIFNWHRNLDLNVQREMSQYVKAFATNPEYLNSNPGIYMV